MAKLMSKLLFCFTLITSAVSVSRDEVPCTVLCNSCENPCQPSSPPPPLLPPPPPPPPECPPPQMPIPSAPPPLLPPPPPPPPPECPPPPMLIPSAPPPQAPPGECYTCTNPPMPLSPPSPPEEPSSYIPPPSGAAYFAPPLYTYNPTPVYVPEDDKDSMASSESPVFPLSVLLAVGLSTMCVFLF